MTGANDRDGGATVDRNDRQFCLNAALRRATRVAVSLYDQEMSASGLQGTQFTLLSTIAGFGSVTIKRLGHHLVMDDTTVTRGIAILRDRDLVTTTPGADRRTREIALTDAGREVLDRAYPLWLRAQKSLWERLGDERANALLDLLADVAKKED